MLPEISDRPRVTPLSRTVPGRTALAVQIAVISLLAVLYLLQMFTPLRLHDDTLRLLSMAESALQGHGFLDHGQATLFPPGYPAVLALLIKLHMAHASVFVGLNLFFVGSGMVALYFILYPSYFRERQLVLAICIFSLLSFGLIKYSSMVLTESCFFGAVMCSLLAIQSTVARLRWRNVILSMLSVTAAICVRRAGVAFIPVLVWALFAGPESQDRIRQLSIRLKIAAGLVLSGFIAGLTWLVYATSTLRDFTGTVAIQRSMTGAIQGLIGFRLREFGEMVVNLPTVAVSSGIQPFVPVLGALLIVVLFVHLGLRWRRLTVVDLFFISYFLIILVWPYYCDLRFWMPVIPLIAAYVVRAAQAVWKYEIGRGLIICYAAVYLFIGSLTMVASAKLSFMGASFGNHYSDYHETYCAAGYCGSSSFDTGNISPTGLHVLRAYR